MIQAAFSCGCFSGRSSRSRIPIPAQVLWSVTSRLFNRKRLAPIRSELRIVQKTRLWPVIFRTSFSGDAICDESKRLSPCGGCRLWMQYSTKSLVRVPPLIPLSSPSCQFFPTLIFRADSAKSVGNRSLTQFCVTETGARLRTSFVRSISSMG
jgi:hypothetical protein